METDTCCLLKQCITRSPLFTAIYPNFKINKNKKLINTTSIDHDNLLSILDWNQLSQKINSESYDFDNDDFDVDELLAITKPNTVPLTNDDDDKKADVTTIDVLLKDSSISINHEMQDDMNEFGRNFNLPYTVRSSCHIIDEANKDDTLVISLKTGYLLLIKFFKVDGKLQPRVIQDINLRQSVDSAKTLKFYHPQLSTLGKQVFVRDKVILITSQLFNIKFCSLGKHHKVTNSINFFIDGQMLMSCFIAINTNHLMFLTLILTSMGKLQFRLFEKWNDENLDQMNQYSPILLSSDFQIPNYLTSINDLVVLIYENSITLLGLNYLISYDLKDCQSHRLFTTSAKITNFQIPATQISQPNEILISTSTGSIYSIEILSLQNVKLKLLYEIPSLPFIDTFTVSSPPTSWSYKLIYSTNASSPGIIRLDPSSFEESENEKLPNWAPIIDHCVVGTKYNEQELWVLGNQNKKTSLYHLHKGCKLITFVNDVFFKNLERIFRIEFNEVYYFVIDFLTHSQMYCYRDCELTLFKDWDGSQFDLSLKTLCLQPFDNELGVHITEMSITLYNFVENEVIVYYKPARKIILAHGFWDYIGIIFEDDEGFVFEILQLKEDSDFVSTYKLSLASLQTSMMKFYEFNDELFATLGFFNNDLIFINVEKCEISNVMNINTIEPEFAVPHDLIQMDGSLVISSKNGYYGILKLPNLNKNTKFKFIKLSNVPIKFEYFSTNEALLISKSVFKLSLDKSHYPDPCYYYGSNSVANGKVNDLVNLGLMGQIISVGPGGMNIAELKGDSTLVVNKRIKLFKNCKKLFDLRDLKLFIVVTGDKYKLEPQLEPLIFINQLSKRKLKVVEFIKVVDKYEVVTTIDDWKFEYSNDRGERKCHLQLLMSCFNLATKRTCIKIVELKKLDNDEISLTRLFQWNCTHLNPEQNVENKVNFIKQFTNDIIVYCLDNEIYKIHYNFQLKKFMKPEFIISAKAEINSLSVDGNLIVFSTANDSFMMLNYIPETQEFKIKSNNVEWTDVYDNLILDNNNLIMTDKYDTVLKVFDTNNMTNPQIEYKTDSLLQMSKCQFSPRWSQQHRTRFITCSLNGEISIYTLLRGKIADKLLKIMRSKSKNKTLNKSFELDYLDDWYINDVGSTKVIESDRLHIYNDEDYDEELDETLHALMI